MTKNSKAKLDANHRYDDKAYFKTLARFPIEAEPEIRAAAARAGESLNGYIVGAVRARMEWERQRLADPPAD